MIKSIPLAGVILLSSAIGGCSRGAESPIPVLQTTASQSPRTEVAARPGQPKSWITRTAGSALVFVSDSQQGLINIFDASTHNLAGQITGLGEPLGMDTDSSNNLYVADAIDHAVYIYAPPYTGTPQILSVGFVASSVHVGRTGRIYIANDNGSGMLVYRSRTDTKPFSDTDGPNDTFYVTDDARGNVWADGFSSYPATTIGYWPNEGRGAFIPVSSSMQEPEALEFDKHGNLLVVDYKASTISVFSAATIYSGTLTASSTIALTGPGVYSAFGLASGGTFVYAGDSDTNVEQYAYPGGGFVGTFNAAAVGPEGFAVVPKAGP